MKRLLLLAMILSLAGCTADSPLSPQLPPAGPGAGIQPSSGSSTSATPPPSDPAPQPEGGNRTAKDSFTWEITQNNGESFAISATNTTNEEIRLNLACYEGIATDPKNQKLFSVSGGRITRPGEEHSFSCEIACGPGQVDLHERDVLEPPIGWERNLVVGRAVTGNGPRCAPPPPPPPPPPVCDVKQLELDARQECEYGFTLNEAACSFECKPKPPTCEELNPPFADNFEEAVGSSNIRASFRANNAGSWTLALYAGNYNNPTRYKKADDSARTRCGGKEELSVWYKHRGHNACLWTLKASGPGLDTSSVVLDRCERD